MGCRWRCCCSRIVASGSEGWYLPALLPVFTVAASQALAAASQQLDLLLRRRCNMLVCVVAGCRAGGYGVAGWRRRRRVGWWPAVLPSTTSLRYTSRPSAAASTPRSPWCSHCLPRQQRTAGGVIVLAITGGGRVCGVWWCPGPGRLWAGSS